MVDDFLIDFKVVIERVKVSLLVLDVGDVLFYKVFCVIFWGYKNGMVGWYDYVVNELLCLILIEKYWIFFCNKLLLENYIDRFIYFVFWKCEYKSYFYNYIY